MWAKDPAYTAMPGYERTRAYRASHPDHVARERRRNAARQRALVRLARARAEDFRAIYEEELAAVGLTGPCDQFDGSPGGGSMEL